MTQSLDGLVAPEGTYRLTASYILPPQPSFMNATTAPGSMASLGTSASSAPSNAVASAGQGGAQSAGGSTTSSSGGGASNSTNSTGGGPTTAGIGNGVNNAAQSSAIGAGASAGLEALPSHQDGGTALEGGLTSSWLAEAGQPKTVLHHISMQAPSAWSHVPVVPPSRISVASVRVVHTAGASTLPSSAISSPLSRKDRQQASHASTATTAGQQYGLSVPSAVDSSVEGSSGSGSDLGGVDMGISDNRPPLARPHWGPVLEATLASQGIDGTASHVTGGAGGLPGMAALQLLSHLSGPMTGKGSSATGGLAANLMQGVAAAGGGGGGGGSGGGGGGTIGGSSGGAGTSAQASKNLPKPRNNIKQTSSSFVQRLQTHPEFPKLLASRADGVAIERHAFISRGRMFFWLAETANGWIKDPLARLTFAMPITAHDVNQQTRAPNRLDVVIGFGSSDLIWLEVVSMRYSRLNKAGCINDAPITAVRWLPGSETMFFTSHSDGTCTLFDVAREDSSAGSWTPISGMSVTPSSAADGSEEGPDEEQEILLHQGDVGDTRNANGEVGDVKQSVRHAFRSWDPRTSMLVTRPGATDNEAVRKTWSKLNPVAHWRIARSVSITDVAFSPDHTKVALVATDGSLRLINLLTESLEGTFQSYYGALNRVVWSPDAKFLLTAGCDDLISVWTSDGRLLSRCTGHASFVTGLAFDPWKWRVEDRTYRFVSVGEDGRVFMWDFSSAALHRPRMPASAQSARRVAGASRASTPSLHTDNPAYARRSSGTGAGRRVSMAGDDQHQGNGGSVPGRAIYHAAKARNEVAELQPVASYQIGPIAGGIAGISAVEGATASYVPFVTAASSHTDPSVSVNGPADGFGPTSSAPTNGASASTASSMPAGHAAASLTAGVATTAQAGQGSTSSLNEPGNAYDLLVDVRCRPDGIVLLHKSGALRYLMRPTTAQQQQPLTAVRS